MTRITLSDATTLDLPAAADLSTTNCGTPGVWRFEGAAPGPRVVMTSLIHGNEVCGAHALSRLVAQPPRLQRGSLTLVFANLAAYARIEDGTKSECRFVDEDMNRVWGRLDGNARSTELDRAREILPFVDPADVLLDLHSMTDPAPALGLVGLAGKNLAFGRRVGFPGLLVRDAGHASGLRLIDRAPYGDPGAPAVAMLVECGEHFSTAALDAARTAVARTLVTYLGGEPASLPVASAEPQKVIEVTHAVTIASDAFRFTQAWPNMAVVPAAGTCLAVDGGQEVRTPYDDAYLVMPAAPRFWKRGLTAVRFGRAVGSG